MLRKMLLPAAAVLTTAAEPAMAGPLTGVVNYIQSNLVTDIEILAMIGVALYLFSRQVHWMGIIGACAGIWLLANVNTVIAAVSGG